MDVVSKLLDIKKDAGKKLESKIKEDEVVMKI